MLICQNHGTGTSGGISARISIATSSPNAVTAVGYRARGKDIDSNRLGQDGISESEWFTPDPDVVRCGAHHPRWVRRPLRLLPDWLAPSSNRHRVNI